MKKNIFLILISSILAWCVSLPKDVEFQPILLDENKNPIVTTQTKVTVDDVKTWTEEIISDVTGTWIAVDPEVVEDTSSWVVIEEVKSETGDTLEVTWTEGVVE